MTYNAIDLAAYQPTGEILQPVFVLRVPAKLRRALETLYRSGLSEKYAPTAQTFPIRSLNDLLPLAAPDVLSVGRRVSISDDVPWLYSLHRVDTDLVRDLIHIWSLGLKGDDRRRQEVERLLDDVPFGWEEETLDLTKSAPSPGGTAQPTEQVYPLLAALLARRIRLEGDLTGGSGMPLSFMETPWRGHGAELVSWPPQMGLPDEPDSWFSYLISVSVQTLPFRPSFRVHVRTGIRRWVTKVGSHGVYTAGRSVSVYLATTTSWPGLSDVRSRLAVHRLRYDLNEGRHAWRLIDRPDLLPHASLIRSPVDAAELGRDPLSFLRDPGSVRAAILYSTDMGTHSVGAGLMAGDRVPFLNAIDHAVSGALERVPGWQRAEEADKPENYQSRPTFSPKFSKEERKSLAKDEKREREKKTAATRRSALRNVISGNSFRAQVLWQDDATRDALVTGLCDVLGLDKPTPSGSTLQWSTDEIEIVLELGRSGDLCGGLDVPVERPTRSELRQAVTARRAEARERLGDPHADGAIIEIDREFKVLHHDPKFMIRLGAADGGVLTQFVQTAEPGSKLANERPHRARQAWLDLFRQLGAARAPLPHLPAALGDEPRFVAVWAIKRQRRSATSPRVWRPIAVRYCPRSSVRVEGWRDDTRRWVPYREFLLWLAQGTETHSADDAAPEIEEDGNALWRRQRETMAFIRPLLSAHRDRPTVLLVHAQNLRSDWPWLKNTTIIPDHIDIGDGEAVPVSLWSPDLRIVRTRDSTRDETPQYYGSGGRHGLPAGLWEEPSALNDRTFFASGERSATGSNAAVGARKEGIRLAAKNREVIDTGTQAYNPNLLEICIASCTPDDSPAELASSVHQLRYAVESEKWLTLPYPLHLAKKAAEYASSEATD